MSVDDLALALQGAFDRFVRRLRLGAPPPRGRKRLLIVQIDGLPRSVLQEGLAQGRMPFLRWLIERKGWQVVPTTAGLPTSTPAFQMAAMYGVRPDIPGFHFHDKRRREDVFFPRAGDASYIEATQTRGRRGIVDGGSAYGCIFTGGAANNLFSLAVIKRPTGQGLLSLGSVAIVFVWVVAKSLGQTVYEAGRALARQISRPGRQPWRAWRWFLVKVALSVWVRQFFTLAVCRDLYRGVPVIYVNYLDYDVFSHSFGPRHPRTMRSLRRLDRSLAQLWRVMRRVPEHRYDFYVLSDHGQMRTTPYASLNGGRAIERDLFDKFFDPAGVREVGAATAGGRRLLNALRVLHGKRAPGFVQRFLGYLERDFIARLGDVRETHERGGIRVVSAGPNAFVYFVDDPEPLLLEEIERRCPGVPEELSRARGIGLVLVRSAAGPVCFWRGKRYGLSELGEGPFAGREDMEVVAEGIRDLMAMRCAGDLVLYGNLSAEGDVSFIPEYGAHAGASMDELYTFVLAPPSARLRPARHPVELYDHFIRYHERASAQAA